MSRNRLVQTVNDLAEILNEKKLTEIEYELSGEQDNVRIKVVKSAAPQTIVSSAAPAVPQQLASAGPIQISTDTTTPDALDSNPGLIKSPMVGLAYLSPSPGANSFVSVGDRVSKGQTLLIIEAMKVLNMIKAPSDGVVKQFFVKNEEPVEYDQRLLLLELV